MATTIERMLEHAADLIERYPASRAAKRRAISGAYYAAFHALLEACADTVLPHEDKTSELYERVYRAIDHKPMKNAFRTHSALRERKTLLLIGEAIVELQSARMRADYLPLGDRSFSLADAERYIVQSRLTVDRIKRLAASDQRTLAVSLLFKDRPRD